MGVPGFPVNTYVSSVKVYGEPRKISWKGWMGWRGILAPLLMHRRISWELVVGHGRPEEGSRKEWVVWRGFSATWGAGQICMIGGLLTHIKRNT